MVVMVLAAVMAAQDSGLRLEAMLNDDWVGEGRYSS